MNLLRPSFFVFLFLTRLPLLNALEGSKKFEGLYDVYETQRLKLIALFLPYNPHIFMPEAPLEQIEECQKVWPKATLLTSWEEIKKKPRLPSIFCG
jgi:hypothetical protein